MKHILVFSLSLLLVANLFAQKKPAAKTTAATAGQKTDAGKNAGTNTTAMQAVYMVNGTPEEFKKYTTEARSNFDAGKLDDSRFALQQMLAELDMIIGKEVLKALPPTMLDKPIVTKLDNVTGASGFLGVIIHREYGKEYSSMDTTESRNINIEIISNSPLIASINSLLSIPLIGNSGDNKVIKIAGYKALVTKSQGNNGEANYDLQLPLGSSLITVKAPGATQEQVAQIAGSLPIQDIARMLQ
ncbi:MAG TPA: hypothetical protein VFT06_03395 [Flavisolibacter sp.]|nr:hypothetical protein [Flavisolibacter sp.]